MSNILNESRVRRIYIASGLENAELVQNLHTKLKESGRWRNTYDWTIHGLIEDTSKHALFAVREVNGVKQAEVLGFVGPGGRGAHFEMGAAVARGTPVVMWDKDPEGDDKKYGYPSLFYSHPLVFQVHSMKEFVSTCNAVWEVTNG